MLGGTACEIIKEEQRDLSSASPLRIMKQFAVIRSLVMYPLYVHGQLNPDMETWNS